LKNARKSRRTKEKRPGEDGRSLPPPGVSGVASPNHIVQQQTGVLFIIMQQVQPDFIIMFMQSQHA
jgi:hypothetical protein